MKGTSRSGSSRLSGPRCSTTPRSRCRRSRPASVPVEHALRPSLIGGCCATGAGSGHGARLPRLAAGDRGAAAGAADRRPALPGQRPDPAALARGDEAGGGARAPRGRRGGRNRDRRRRGRLGGARTGAPGHAGTGAIALALALVAIPIALPFVLRRRGGGHAGGDQRRLRLRLDRDRQQAADRRAGRRGRCSSRPPGWRRRPSPRAWPCSAR